MLETIWTDLRNRQGFKSWQTSMEMIKCSRMFVISTVPVSLTIPFMLGVLSVNGRALELRLILLILCGFLQGLPYIDLKIKWPNDLYVNDLKVGGILCTSTYRSKKFNVTAGVLFFPSNFLLHSFFPFQFKTFGLHTLHQFEKPSVVVIYFNCFMFFQVQV